MSRAYRFVRFALQIPIARALRIAFLALSILLAASASSYILLADETRNGSDALASTEQYILYDVPLSAELQTYTQDVCKEYGVSYRLVLAIMQQESDYDPDAASGTGDYGIMQINQCNHTWLSQELGISDWFDAKQNILAGVFYLSQFTDYQDSHKILMCYNCGPTGAQRLWSDGIYDTAYSRAVVEKMNRLEVRNDAQQTA